MRFFIKIRIGDQPARVLESNAWSQCQNHVYLVDPFHFLSDLREMKYYIGFFELQC